MRQRYLYVVFCVLSLSLTFLANRGLANTEISGAHGDVDKVIRKMTERRTLELERIANLYAEKLDVLEDRIGTLEDALKSKINKKGSYDVADPIVMLNLLGEMRRSKAEYRDLIASIRDGIAKQKTDTLLKRDLLRGQSLDTTKHMKELAQGLVRAEQMLMYTSYGMRINALSTERDKATAKAKAANDNKYVAKTNAEIMMEALRTFPTTYTKIRGKYSIMEDKDLLKFTDNDTKKYDQQTEFLLNMDPVTPNAAAGTKWILYRTDWTKAYSKYLTGDNNKYILEQLKANLAGN